MSAPNSVNQLSDASTPVTWTNTKLVGRWTFPRPPFSLDHYRHEHNRVATPDTLQHFAGAVNPDSLT